MIDPDEFYDHLEACVQAAGGAKAVGQLLWPDKSPDAAHRLMLDCLNPDRPAKLAPEQLLRVLRLARDCGYHGGVGYILESLQYLPTRPQSFGDQVAEIQTQLAATARSFQGLVMRVERLTLTAGGQGAHG